MSSRDVVLGRLRAALRDRPKAVEVPRQYRRSAPERDLIGVLADRLTDYKAVVHHASLAEVPSVIGGILAIGAAAGSAAGAGAGGPAPRIAVPSGPAPRIVVPGGLDRDWLPDGVEVLADDGLSVEVLAGVDGVVTAAAVAVAETGTIVLDGSADQGRRVVSLLPDLHICVLRSGQVVPGVPEALARLDPRRPLTWISGPSATSDIELDRVEGVHGPRRLHVILVADPGSARGTSEG